MYKMHQGSIVRRMIKKSGYPITAIARKLYLSRATLYKRFQQEKLPQDFLLAMGAILGYDFIKRLPILEKSTKKYLEALLKTQEDYIYILEKYLGLFCIAIKVIDQTKKTSVRKAIIQFIKKKQVLPLEKTWITKLLIPTRH